MKKNIFAVVSFILIILLFLAYLTSGVESESLETTYLWQEYKTNLVVTDVAVGENYVWGITSEGVIRWQKDDHSYTKLTTADGLIDANVLSVLVDDAGDVWFGTPSGLSRFDGQSWAHYTTADGLSSNVALSLSLGPQGQLLVGSPRSASVYDGVSWRSYSPGTTRDPSGCLTDSVLDVAMDLSGRIWLTNRSAPVCYLDGTEWRMFFQDSLSVSAIDIEVHPNGDIWFAGVYHNGQGLGRLKPDGSWTLFTSADGLLDNNTTSLAIDDNGNIWVGANGFSSYQQGLSRFDGTNWESFTLAQGYYGGRIFDVEFDKATGELWTGSDSVSRFKNGKWQTYLTGLPISVPGGFVYDIALDNDENLWVGLFRNGVVKYDGRSWIQYTVADGLAGDLVYDIAVDNNGSLWFASYKEEFSIIGMGLTRYDGNSWQTYTTADGLSSNFIEDIAVDQDNSIWVAYRYGSGVSHKTATGWTHYTTSDGLLEDRVGALFAEGNTIWAGYSGGYAFRSGVSKYENSSWANFTASNGLIYEAVGDFTLDKDGNLLALAWNGVNRYDGANWSGFSIPLQTTSEKGSEIAVDKNNNIWIVGYSYAYLYNGIDWTVFGENDIPVSRLQSNLAINAAGDEIWFDSLDGIVQLRLLNLTEKVFLPLLSNN